MDLKYYESIAKQVKENEKQYKEEMNQYIKQEPAKDIHGDCDYVWAPEKGAATVMYIFAMIFGSIFNARILVWIIATLVYSNFMSRHKK